MSIHSKGASIWVMKTVIWGQKQRFHYQDMLVQLGINYSDLTPTSGEKRNVQNIVPQQFRIAKHSFLIQSLSSVQKEVQNSSTQQHPIHYL